MSFDTPLQIFGKDFKNSFRINQQRNNFPQSIALYDLNTGQVTDTRIFAATYRTDIDWVPDFTLPPFARNRFNLSPSVSFANVDPGPYWVATNLSDGKYVHQSKRISVGLSASPTIFGLFPGFGPFTRFRHSITPSFGYSWAPASHVSDDYLLALGRTKFGYLGNLEQNALNFGLTQNVEAKVRNRTDTTGNAPADDPSDSHAERDAADVRFHPRQGPFVESGSDDGAVGLQPELGSAPGIRLLCAVLTVLGKHAQRYREVRPVPHERVGVAQHRPRSESAVGVHAALRSRGSRGAGIADAAAHRRSTTGRRGDCRANRGATGRGHGAVGRSVHRPAHDRLEGVVLIQPC